MCNIWTGDEVTGQAPCPWRSSFIWVSGALPGLEELCMFWSDISQDWEVWIGWTVCWKTWKPFLCPAWYGPLTQGYSVQSVNQSVPEASHSGQMSSSWFSARPWRTPSPRWCLMDEGPWHEQAPRLSGRHLVALWCPWWNLLSAGTVGLHITVPWHKNHGRVGFVFVSVGATVLVVTVQTKEINYWKSMPVRIYVYEISHFIAAPDSPV